VGQSERKPIKTFAEEWERIRRTGDLNSPLFASSYVAPKQRQRKTSLTTKQAAYRQATYHPQTNPTIWSEYSGMSAHHYTGYSPLYMEQVSKRAQQVFAQTDYVLSKFKSRW
jgi:hypothetical protein